MNKELNINDLRRAIMYVVKSSELPVDLANTSDEKLSKMDFLHDLRMGNIRVVNVLVLLNRIHDLDLSMDVFNHMPNNTVEELLHSINEHIKEDS